MPQDPWDKYAVPIGGAATPAPAQAPATSSSDPWDRYATPVGGSSPQIPVTGNEPPTSSASDGKTWYQEGWDWLNTPLTEQFGLPAEREGAGGFERAAEHILSGLTSPLSLALTAATFGTGGFIESAGSSALREAGLTAEEIANAEKASQVATEAYKSLGTAPIKEALEAGGHDLGLLQKAKDALGPVDLSDTFAEEGGQNALSRVGLSPAQRKALADGTLSAAEREKIATANGGFSDEELEALGKAGNTISKAKENFTPVEDAVRSAGLDYDKFQQASSILRENGLTEEDLTGGNALVRGAFQILRKTVPDLPIATSARLAKTANSLLSAGFTLQQFQQAAALSPRFLDALKEGDVDAAEEYGTEALAGTVLGLAGAPHALHAAGELFDPILEPTAKLRPSDEVLKYNQLHGEREALHSVADQQGIDRDRQIRAALGHTKPGAQGDSPEVKAQKELDLATVFHQVVTGGDQAKAAAWHNALAEAAGKDERMPVAGETPKTYEELQDQIDRREEELEKERSTGTKFYFPNSENLLRTMVYEGPDYTPESLLAASNKFDDARSEMQAREVAKLMRGGASFKQAIQQEGSGWLANKLGGNMEATGPVSPEYKPYPQDVQKLYAQRDEIGSNQLKQSVADVSSRLQKNGITDPDEIRAVMDLYALNPNKTDVFAQYAASQYTEGLVAKPLKQQLGKIYSALAHKRGLGDTIDDEDDFFRDKKITEDAKKALKAVQSYFNRGDEPEPKALPEIPNNGKPQYLPENIADQIRDSKFKSLPEAYQNTVLNSLKKVATGDLSEKVKAAAKIAQDEQARNFELGSANDVLHNYVENYMTRIYKDENQPGKVVAADAKTGRFATNVTMARQRVYDSHITALLKSPKQMDFDAAKNVAQGREQILKAAANRQFLDALRDNNIRASDGRPVVVLSGSGQVVRGPEGEDPATYIQPERVRKIQIADKVISQMRKSGELDRMLDTGDVREVTPLVYPDTVDTAIQKLTERAQRLNDPRLLAEVQDQLESLQKAKRLSGQQMADALTEYNSKLKKMYVYDPQDYIKLDNPALKGWKFSVNDTAGNGVFANTDIRVHPEFAENLQNRLGLEQSALQKSPISKALLAANTKLKETLLSMSPFHMAQLALRSVMVGVNPLTLNTPDILNGEKIDPADPNSPSIIRKLVEHGFTPGTDYRAEQKMSEGVSAGSPGLLRKAGPIGRYVANSMDWYQDFLFKRFMPALKANAGEKLFRDYQAKHPDWTVDHAAKVTAAHVNDTFGGINWKAMGRSATTQDWGRLMLLAPDWLESEMRSMGRLFNKDEGGIARSQVVKMAGGLWFLARTLNLMNTGNMHLEAPFGLATKNKDGKEIIYSIRTLPTDMLHAASDPVNFIKGRLSPNLNNAIELTSGRDRYGRKLGPEDLWVDIARNMAPIPFQSIGQAVSGTGPQVGNAGQGWKAIGGTATAYQTPAQKLAADLAAAHSEDGPIDPSQMARHRRVMEMEDAVRRGDMTTQDLTRLTYQTDQLKESELKKITENLKKTEGMDASMASLYTRASRLPAKEYLQLLDTMNPSEKTALIPLTVQVQKKYLTKAKKDETPLERAQDPVFQRFIKMIPQQPGQQTSVPGPQSALRFPFTATHPDTKHVVGSPNGTDWFDAQTGEPYNG